MHIDIPSHGFIRLVDVMGDDAAIVQAARVSYGEGTTTAKNDASLIRYLMRHHHTSPFEMCEIKVHVKLPIFIARQWLRHRTANVNEYSGRYSIMRDEFYFPEPSEMCGQSKTNKQGSGEPLDDATARLAIEWIDNQSQGAHDIYSVLVDDDGQFGLAREDARIILPLNIYTELYWKIDLHNLFHFMRLRSDKHSQRLIREYSRALETIVQSLFPIAYAAWVNYQRDAVTFSAAEMKLITAQTLIDKPDEFSAGEWREFLAKLGIEQ